MHLSFNLPIAPRLFYRRDDSVEVALESGREALHLGKLRREDSNHPRFQRFGILILEYLAELLRQFFGRGDLRMCGDDRLDPTLFCRVAQHRRFR